ncbi:MAG: haloacid dehalogenase type II [Actinomycetota bacterium]|nr:haloacid dehalogenase type II [Actinomycetota bacterium]
MPIDGLRPKVLTFDCYGTLADVRRATVDALSTACRRWPDLDPEELADSFAEYQFAALQQPYRKFRDVLASTLRRVLEERGREATDRDAEALVERLSCVEPFPDTSEALRRLKDDYELGVITNSDDDIIAGTIAALDVPIDYVVTAQQVGRYKPSAEVFHHALTAVGCRKDELVHVAASKLYDIDTATRLGWRTVWVNRGGSRGDGNAQPWATVRQLNELPDALAAGRVPT